MQYRQLGKWGLRLSTIGLGSYLTIGMSIDDEEAKRCVARAIDLGVNWFDTANAYNHGRAEEVLGSCLSAYSRDSFVLTTKVWAPMGKGPNDRGLSAKHVREQCQASLRRLKMDTIDLYLCHRPDPTTPLEETIRTMDDLARQGKIIYWGVSEWPAALIAETVGLAKEMGCRPPAADEPRYSLLYRHPEEDLFPTTLRLGLGNVLFSALAHGMLTGKYAPGQPPPPGTRAADDAQNMVIKRMYWSEENLVRCQQLPKLAKAMGISAAQLALAWCLRHPAVTSCIIGASRASQIEENVKAAEVTIPEEVLKKLDELFPAPAGPE
jgi:aryl-alcohol dehydrogenase-like predicted oxidoreductase